MSWQERTSRNIQREPKNPYLLTSYNLATYIYSKTVFTVSNVFNIARRMKTEKYI